MFGPLLSRLETVPLLELTLGEIIKEPHSFITDECLGHEHGKPHETETPSGDYGNRMTKASFSDHDVEQLLQQGPFTARIAVQKVTFREWGRERPVDQA